MLSQGEGLRLTNEENFAGKEILSSLEESHLFGSPTKPTLFRWIEACMMESRTTREKRGE
jgi:hypothetical protein